MENEREQIEELRRWWKENGRTAVIGVILGLGAVAGWNGWQRYQQGQQEMASVRYEQLLAEVKDGNHAQAVVHAKSLIEDFPRSGYAPLAALLAARGALADGNAEEARKELRWAIAHGKDLAVRDLARLRLGRLLIQLQDNASALALANKIETPSFRGLGAELKGDALVASGESEKARAAYADALKSTDLPAASRARIRMKLDDIGVRKLWKGPQASTG